MPTYTTIPSKFRKFFQTVRKNGGWWGSIKKLYYMEELKEGTYKGIDCFGNRYYENTRYMLCRSRWVEYSPQLKLEYDASQVTPDWHGWLHYKTDLTPCEEPAKVTARTCCWTARWLLPPTENMTSTPLAYYPYTTARPMHCVWDGTTVEKFKEC